MQESNYNSPLERDDDNIMLRRCEALSSIFCTHVLKKRRACEGNVRSFSLESPLRMQVDRFPGTAYDGSLRALNCVNLTDLRVCTSTALQQNVLWDEFCSVGSHGKRNPNTVRKHNTIEYSYGSS